MARSSEIHNPSSRLEESKKISLQMIFSPHAEMPVLQEACPAAAQLRGCGALNSRPLFLTVLELGRVHQGASRVGCLGKAPSRLQAADFSWRHTQWEETDRHLWPLLLRSWSQSWGLYPHDPAVSQIPLLHTILLGLRFHHMSVGVGCKHSVHS